MTDIASALSRAAQGLLHPRMLWLAVWPLALSIALWIVLAVFFGSQVFTGIEGYLNQSEIYQKVSTTWPISMIATGLLWLLMFLLWIPLVLITATLIIGVVAMPMVVKHVSDRDFPALERRRGGTVAGSVWNAILAVVMLVVLIVVTSPLWLVPLLWPVLPPFLFGYVNQRVFRYDALAEHASGEEMRTLIGEGKKRLWGIGMILGLIGHIPLIGFFAPVYSALAFTYYCLERLAVLRSSPTGSPRR